MTESEAIKICNTIGFATSSSNHQLVPLNTTKDELTEAMRMSIQALEKQIPKKPKKIEAEGFRYTDAYRCPLCGGNFSGTGIANYCYHCGKKLDWSDEE